MSSRVAGFILAGGRGQRMGLAHKGLLRHPTKGTILAHLLGELTAAGIEWVVLVADDAEPYAAFGLPVIADLRTGKGPLGGVEAALRHLRDSGLGQAALFLPCDVPAITRREIAALLDAFARDPRGVKVAAVAGESRLHALCCVVGVDVLPAVQEALDEGRQKITDLWRRLGAQAVEFPDGRPFVNVNTPEELSGWLAEGRGPLPVIARVHVQPELREKVLPLIAAGRLAVELAEDGPCDIRVETGSREREGSADVLYAGGWIACPTAWGLAKKHGLPLAALGELLDALDIRVRRCALGCFP